MTAFWIVAALMVALALAFFVPPMLRGHRAGDDSVGRLAEETRRQLKSLEQAHRDGHVSEADYRERKEELTRILMEKVGESDSPEPAHRAPVAAVVLVLIAPLFAVLLYRAVGDPVAIRAAEEGWLDSMPGTPAAGRSGTQSPAPGAGAESAPDLAQAVQGLEQRLQANPDDAEGWFLLGRSYMTLQQFDKASEAYARANELAPDQPPIMVDYAESLAFTSGQSSLPAQASELLRRTLDLDPDSQKALWLMGLGELQAERAESALGYWQKLLDQLEPGSEIATTLAEQMNQARNRLEGGLAGVGLPPDHPPIGESEEPPAPVAEAQPAQAPPAESVPATDGDDAPGITVEVSLASELADSVQPSDTVFIFARAVTGPPMPLAIQRLAAGQLPITVRLDESMAMMPAMSIATFPEVVVGARISRTGDATPSPGDLQALSEPVSNRRAEPVRLRIDTIL